MMGSDVGKQPSKKVYLSDEKHAILYYTIAVLFGKLPSPKVNHCSHMDIRYSTFDIGSHVISCFRELQHVTFSDPFTSRA